MLKLNSRFCELRHLWTSISLQSIIQKIFYS
jgi:hypothetical protein